MKVTLFAIVLVVSCTLSLAGNHLQGHSDTRPLGLEDVDFNYGFHNVYPSLAGYRLGHSNFGFDQQGGYNSEGNGGYNLGGHGGYNFGHGIGHEVEFGGNSAGFEPVIEHSGVTYDKHLAHGKFPAKIVQLEEPAVHAQFQPIHAPVHVQPAVHAPLHVRPQLTLSRIATPVTIAKQVHVPRAYTIRSKPVALASQNVVFAGYSKPSSGFQDYSPFQQAEGYGFDDRAFEYGDYNSGGGHGW